MNRYQIDVDEEVYDFLKQKAEPFVDTPNSVLRKILFSKIETSKNNRAIPAIPDGIPKAMEQILEVVFEIKQNGRTRTEATNIVAKKRGIAPQTIQDKYCRQLDKKAPEIDKLLGNPDLTEFKLLLEKKFIHHKKEIVSFFESLIH
jgi:hypothetical protein